MLHKKLELDTRFFPPVIFLLLNVLLVRCHMDLQSPRRNCCRVVSSPKEGSGKKMTIDVGVCREGEFTQVAAV